MCRDTGSSEKHTRVPHGYRDQQITKQFPHGTREMTRSPCRHLPSLTDGRTGTLNSWITDWLNDIYIVPWSFRPRCRPRYNKETLLSSVDPSDLPVGLSVFWSLFYPHLIYIRFCGCGQTTRLPTPLSFCLKNSTVPYLREYFQNNFPWSVSNLPTPVYI